LIGACGQSKTKFKKLDNNLPVFDCSIYQTYQGAGAAGVPLARCRSSSTHGG
jgi:hypothetical protein